MKRYRTHNGQVVIFFLAIMSIGLLLATALLSLQDNSLRTIKRSTTQQRANYLAESGIDRGLDQLTIDPAYAGETLIFSNDPLVISLEDNGDGTRQLKATATVGESTARYHATIKADNSLQFGSFSAY